MASRRDRRLGMDRPITRRDFLNGVRITIANSDAAAYAYTNAAIDMAHRAVEEITVG